MVRVLGHFFSELRQQGGRGGNGALNPVRPGARHTKGGRMPPRPERENRWSFFELGRADKDAYVQRFFALPNYWPPPSKSTTLESPVKPRLCKPPGCTRIAQYASRTL